MFIPLTTFDNLHQILRNLYVEMMPLCGNMAGVAKGIAGLGALFFVASRVWQSLARAEPIDVYPLLRPFALGLCIMFFPTVVLGTLNGVLSPVVSGTHQILQSQTLDMASYRTKRDRLENEALRSDPATAYLVDNAEYDRQLEEAGILDSIGMYFERASFNMKRMIQKWFQDLLELLFQAAALVIDTIRTFFLVVLSILGPVAFAISCWDGFQATLTQWFTRYVSVYLWLPCSDLFSSILARIQVLILDADIQAYESGTQVVSGTQATYIVFMLIGIVGYFTIPTVANWIIQSGGMGNYNKNVNDQAKGAGKGTVAVGGWTAGQIAGRLKGSGGES